MTDADRLSDLKRKLAAREGKDGFAENAAHLRDEIAALEQKISAK
jgi:protein-arginine kinase activator protein McsA